MKVYGVIMAGGDGTRFWPLSRQDEPKQLLNLSGKNLMINETIDRISGIIPQNDIFIITNEKQVPKMKSAVLDRILDNHILSEPSSRNTTACIGYAAIEIIEKYGDGVMCVFPSDHYIENTWEFSNIVKKGIEMAENTDSLITIGIQPTYPSTGYGYIKYDKTEKLSAKPVLEFKEKPDLKTARLYIDSQEYVWNSGMFVWRASVILENICTYLPEVYDCLLKIKDSMNTDEEEITIRKIYGQIPAISIDYGIMEKSKDVVVIPGDFGWNDVGSWDNLGVLYESDAQGNVIVGNQINIDTRNCISFSKKRLITTIGVSDLIIVETEDSILVCDKNRAQDVKLIVDVLKEKGKEEYL